MTQLCVLWLALVGDPGLPAGTGKMEVTAGPKQIAIEVFTYKPAAYREGPLIFVFHGMLRNAEVYRDNAKHLGDRLNAVIAVPHFDKERFPNECYQQGGVRQQGELCAKVDWTFSRIPEIAAEIRRRESRPEMPYYLLGHSAGGQFAERLTGFLDSGAVRIVAANPGTHLVPTREQTFPYGFGGLPEEHCSDVALRRYLAQPLTIYLGTADNLVDEHLTVGPEADAQGAVRLERGRKTFEFARQLAHNRGWTFHWRLIEAQGVKHDHTLMFNHARASEALFHLNPVYTVGHRGLLHEAPENTLANFRACLELRLGFEFDVQRTRDGQLVCLHDDSVDRTTDGTGKIGELRLEEVRKLDAGRWFAPEFAGEGVPTIDEVFGLLAAHRQKHILAAVDIKAADSQVEADLVRFATRHKILDRLVFIGRAITDAEVRSRLKKANKEARVARLVGDAAELNQALDDESSD